MTASWLGPKDVARRAGVSTDTLRHYERQGVLAKPSRSVAGYRRYAPGTVERVLLIQRTLAMGFSLTDIKRILNLRDRGGVPCGGVRELVAERLVALNRQIEETLSLRDELVLLLREWDDRLATTPHGERAHLLETLGEHPVIETARRRRTSRTRQQAVRRGA